MFLNLSPKVTEGKAKVEKALKLNKKLRKESAAVQDFINRSNHELDVREQASPGFGIEKDLHFAKVGITSTHTHSSLPDNIFCKIL